MKFLLLVAICASVALAFPSTDANAEKCTASKCDRTKGCVCSSSASPLDRSNTPQFVTLTFDDSVTSIIYDTYYKQLLFNRKNADGSPISATFYVPHQYTDYEKVNSLYNEGFEVAVNSISKDTADYFERASTQLLIDEFLGQREILSKFANIPIGDVKGVRTPHFQLAGDRTFEAYKQAGLEYDSSWTTLADSPFFPYTLDYKTEQQCFIGQCPTQSYPGFWILPIINVIGPNDNQCNVLFACQINGTATEIRDWLIEQYQRRSQDDRAPMSLLINSALFELVENSYRGVELFLNYLQSQTEAFLVSHSEVLKWSKNPVELSKYKPSVSKRSQSCKAITCPLLHGELETRYMKSCVPCPDVYPWVGNPQGNQL